MAGTKRPRGLQNQDPKAARTEVLQCGSWEVAS